MATSDVLCWMGNSCSLYLVMYHHFLGEIKVNHMCAYFKIVAHLQLVCSNVFLFIWQESCDAISGTCMRRLAWISKARSKQRAGRAGRTRRGFCYHLFSKTQYKALQAYNTPEILRMPLQVTGDG